MKYVIGVKETAQGFTVQVNNKNYAVSYPPEIWQTFPQNLHKLIAETAAYYFTYHLYFKNKTPLRYEFAPSITHSLFIHGLFMTLPEAVLELPKAKFSIDALFKMLYQSQHDLQYSHSPKPQPPFLVKPYESLANKVIFPLSMGKDSLLTFALTRELGLIQRPVFFVEPHSVYEVNNKKKLGKEFMQKFDIPITYIQVPLGSLREKGGTQWGWDLMLTQYTLLLLPYLYYEKAGYLLWSQEQNYNISNPTEFGLTITMNYDETNKWRQALNSLLAYFGSPAYVGSLNEPLLEFSDTFILHHRYPDIAKFQLSCDNDHKNARTSRWCHACRECARFYVYLLAYGIDPKTIGITENMLTAKHIRDFDIFDDKKVEENYVYQFTPDLLFALYLVYKRGIKGAVVERFSKQYLTSIERILTELIDKYTRLYSSDTVPEKLWRKIVPIYKSELIDFRRLINSCL